MALLQGCDTPENIHPRYDSTFIKLLGSDYQDMANKLIKIDDGTDRLALLGSTTESGATQSNTTKDMILTVFNENGSDIKVYVLGRSGIDETPSCMKYYNGDILIGGTARVNGIDNYMYLRFSMNTESVLNYRNDIGDLDSMETCKDLDIFENNASWGDGIILTGYRIRESKRIISSTLIHFDGSFIRNDANIYDYNAEAVNVMVNGSNEYLIFGIFKIGTSQPKFILYSAAISSRQAYDLADELADTSQNDQAVKLIRGPGDFITLLGYKIKASSNDLSQGVIISQRTTSGGFPAVGDKNYKYLNTINMIPLDAIISNDGGSIYLLGIENEEKANGTNVKSIKLAKLSSDLNLEWEESFGSGENLYPGGALVQLDNGSIIFTSTINYQLATNSTKIAIYKVTPDGKLDF